MQVWFSEGGCGCGGVVGSECWVSEDVGGSSHLNANAIGVASCRAGSGHGSRWRVYVVSVAGRLAVVLLGAGGGQRR